MSVDVAFDDLGSMAIMRGQFREKIATLDCLAKAGYTAAARERASLFAKHLRKGWPIPTDEFLRLCDWLDKIAGGADPASVLGVKKTTRGKEADINRLNRLNDIAETVWHFHNEVRSLEGNRNQPGAFSLAAEHWRVNEATVRKAWEVFGESYKKLETEWHQGLPKLSPIKRKKK